MEQTFIDLTFSKQDEKSFARIMVPGHNCSSLFEGLKKEVFSIHLEGSMSLALPKGLTKLEDVYVFDSSSVVFPEGITSVRRVEIAGSSSVRFSKGLENVQQIYINDSASLTFAKGVKSIGDIELNDHASFVVPEGVERIGEITIFDEDASIVIPESVKSIGTIFTERNSGISDISDNAKSIDLRIPDNVKSIRNIFLCVCSNIVLPKNLERIERIELMRDSSVTFPDGFVLKADDVLSEGQHFRAFLGNELKKLFFKHCAIGVGVKQNAGEDKKKQRQEAVKKYRSLARVPKTGKGFKI